MMVVFRIPIIVILPSIILAITVLGMMIVARPAVISIFPAIRLPIIIIPIGAHFVIFNRSVVAMRVVLVTFVI